MNLAAASNEETQEDRAQKRVATVIAGRWYLESVLGVGGMASVFKAVHYRNGRKVAVKILHDELATVQEIRERFYLEAYAANRVGHPGVVPALDDGVLPNGTPFLIMEYLEGETLEDRWKRNNRCLSVTDVAWISERLLDILVAAHETGIIHRDIKPENIFLTRDSEVRLLDFGIAHLRSQLFPTKTRAGAVMGTPAFMPPEQARGRWREVDARSDLFSVAATMYTLLSGRMLHEAETSNEYLLAAMTHPPLPLRQVAPHVPECIAAVVDRGVAFSKADRYDSAQQMKEALKTARNSLGLDLKEAEWAQPRPALESSERIRLSVLTQEPVVTSEVAMPPRPDLSSQPKHRLMISFAAVASAFLGFAAVQSGHLSPDVAFAAWERGTEMDPVVLNGEGPAPTDSEFEGASEDAAHDIRLQRQPVFDERAVRETNDAGADDTARASDEAVQPSANRRAARRNDKGDWAALFSEVDALQSRELDADSVPTRPSEPSERTGTTSKDSPRVRPKTTPVTSQVSPDDSEEDTFDPLARRR